MMNDSSKRHAQFFSLIFILNGVCNKRLNPILGFRTLITYLSHICHLGLGTSPADLPHDGSEQLPRPLLVIKGTTPTTVTLEWEWSLLPEQIAGADVLYSVLILGSKFHSNITSSLW